LHIQNGGSKRIWNLTYSWTGNFLLAWAGQFAGIENQTMHRFEQYLTGNIGGTQDEEKQNDRSIDSRLINSKREREREIYSIKYQHTICKNTYKIIELKICNHT
jgi:hypothetical protein